MIGELGVHWLRYLLAYGPQAQEELNHQGHGYLADLLPLLLATAVALAAAAAILRLAAARHGTQFASLATGVAPYALALLLIFTLQELSEGELAAGHAAGLAGVLGQGGWLAIPLALVIGGALSGLDRLLIRSELRLVGMLLARRSPRQRSNSVGRVPEPPFVAPMPCGLLAFGFARRPPPALPSR